MMFSFSLMLISLYFPQGNAACPGTFGSDPPSSRANSLESDTGRNYFMEDSALTIDCCGVITGFTIIPGRTGTLYYQVWKPTGTTDEYELVGQVEHVIAGGIGSTTTKSLAAADQITVESGYKFGWYTSGQDIVKHKDVGSDTTYSMSLGALTTGHIQSWSAPTTTKTNRDYGILVTVGLGSPSFTNVAGATPSVPDSTALSSTVFTVTYSGDSVSMTANAYFQLNTGTGVVSVLSSLASAPASVGLSLTVTDGCTTDTETLTITITNDPPDITSLPASGSIHEDITASTLLHTLVVTDTADTPSCSLASTAPAGGPFSYLAIPSTSDYGIYTDSNPTYSASSYVITISCSDDRTSTTADFTLTVTPNQPPAFTNLPNTTTVSTTNTIGTEVFVVSASDAEGDSLHYNMTCTPATCPFTLLNSGQLQLDTDIRASKIAQYIASVYVADSKNLVGPSTLTIDVTDINVDPTVDNLPLAAPLSVRENTVTATTVYDVICSDDNVPATQTLTYTMTGTPGTALTYFEINSSNGLITTTSTPLDYETLDTASTTTFTMVITCSDGIASNSATLTLTVTDENERPTFSQASYSLSAAEGLGGTSLGTPGFGLTDPDSGDTATLSFDCGAHTGYFLMDTSSGEVTYASDYDLDSGTRPATVSCTVTVRDRGSLTSTCALTLQINAANDNSPVFTATAYSFFASQGFDVNAVVGTVTATDADSGTNGDVTYTLHNNALALQYFGVNSAGEVYVKQGLSSFNESQIIAFDIQATDPGGNVQTTSVSIIIYPTTTQSTTPPGDRFKTCSEDAVCVAWITACVMLLMFIIVLFGRMTYAGHLPAIGALWKSCLSCLRQRKPRRGVRKWRLDRPRRVPRRGPVLPRRTRPHPTGRPPRSSIEVPSYRQQEIVEAPTEMFEFWREKDNRLV